MSKLSDDLFDRFHEIHSDLIKAVEGLPDAALDWIPGKDMNSINVLVVHLTGAEKFWIGAVALGEPTDRVREEEFRARGLTAEGLKKLLIAADEYAREALSRFKPEDLEMVRTSPSNGKKFTVGWCQFHALEHSALHLGHIQVTRQWWEQRAG
jgi:uncharacterized damage-inducible protein DinB